MTDDSDKTKKGEALNTAPRDKDRGAEYSASPK